MDITYLLILQKLREATGAVADGLFLNITAMGEGLITYLVMAFVYWCVDKRAGQLMALNVSFASTFNQFIKNICKIERPWVRDERIAPVEAAVPGAGGYSFPSGHTQRGCAVWGALGVSLWKNQKRGVGAVCWAVVALLAFSRNYLGVHTPQDVLFALMLGIALILILDRVMVWTDGGPNRDVAVAAIGCLLCFLPMLKVGCLSNAGAGMGFLIGWALERHFVRFETKDPWPDKCVRFALGGAGIVFILTVVSRLFNLVMAGKYAGFFTGFVLAVFIMVLYPFFFCKKERYRAGVVLLAVILFGMGIFSIGWQRRIKEHAQTEAAQAAEEAVPEDVLNAEEGVKAENGTEQAGKPDSASNEQTQLPVLVRTPEQIAIAEGLPKIVAHRGYSAVFPENTLAAFAGALDIGVDYIELDVQLSKDGQVVVLHDGNLARTTGVDGLPADYTLEELSRMDAGSWFDASFSGEKIPTLQEALELIRDADANCNVYLELKDIGDVEGFEEAVLEVTDRCGMTQRCMFASFRYEYLEHFKELNSGLVTLYNTLSGKATLPEEYPADCYGLNMDVITQETVSAIHQSGSQAFVWTVSTPEQVKNVQAMGVDGIVTNYPGMARVIRHSEYEYLSERCEGFFTMPGLYGADLPAKCADMVVQGFTKAGSVFAVSAYDKTGEGNSILYLMNQNGSLLKIVDLQFKAHTGGIAYDEGHDLLWVTGPEGKVYGISWQGVLDDTYHGEILVEFDAQLRNHNDSKVASFLTYFEGKLFVGSWVNGAEGRLRRYDLTDAFNPEFEAEMVIPQRIQGITFKRDGLTGECNMWLSQGYETEDAHLLKYSYDEQISAYTEPLESHVIPEGAEQVQMSARGMYILFESAARPYRATARIANDQIWLVRE